MGPGRMWTLPSSWGHLTEYDDTVYPSLFYFPLPCWPFRVLLRGCPSHEETQTRSLRASSRKNVAVQPPLRGGRPPDMPATA